MCSNISSNSFEINEKKNFKKELGIFTWQEMKRTSGKPTFKFVKIYDKVELFENKFYVKDSPNCVIFLHGLGDHQSRNLEVKEFFNKYNWSVYMYDARGMGRSTKSEDSVENFSAFSDDLRHILKNRIDDEFKNIFIVSVGFGASYTLYLECKKSLSILNERIRGLITISPMISLEENFSKLKVKFINLIGSVAPKLNIEKPLNVKLYSRKLDVTDSLKNDKLFYNSKIKAGFGKTVKKCLSELQSEMEDNVKVPLFIITGTEDKIVNCNSSKILFNFAGSKDKTLFMYKGFYHDIIHDVDGDIVLYHCLRWMQRRVKKEKHVKKLHKLELEDIPDKKVDIVISTVVHDGVTGLNV